MLPDFKIVLRPNNQVTVVRQSVIHRQDRYELLPDSPRIPKNAINTFVNHRADREGLKTFYSKGLRHDCLDAPATPLPLPLDLIHRFQHKYNLIWEYHERKKLGYGKTPKIKYFSHKAGQKLRETGSIIDRLCGSQTERCRVVTLTIPSSEHRAFKAISDYSGLATNRLFQIVRRSYPDALWFYVWEHQKRGALHMHICVYHDDSKISEQIGKEFCEKWITILQDITVKTGVDMLYSKGFGRRCQPHEMQLDNQAMRLSCGGYFSKYASKNSGKHDQGINSVNARRYPPSSFWGRSRQLARMCEEQAFRFSHQGLVDDDADKYESEAIEIIRHCRIVKESSSPFKKEVNLSKEYGGDTLTICEGFCQTFYVHPKDYQKLLAHFRFLYADRRTSAVTERSKVSGSMVNMFCPEVPENEIF
jgi:hypothetical protein